MRDRLILLPGWGLGTAPLQPLADALRGLDPRLHVQIEPLPLLDSNDPADWLDELDAKLPEDAWLGGWSLGGMLAAELAARRGGRCSGLLTLASNLRFVAEPGWSAAMEASTFSAFREGCAANAPATLKRFALLCVQGAADARGLSRQLISAAPHSQAASAVSWAGCTGGTGHAGGAAGLCRPAVASVRWCRCIGAGLGCAGAVGVACGCRSWPD